MRSPWNIRSPFGPMYDEEVVFTAGGARRSVRCCVFLDQTGDPLCEASVDSTREDILIGVWHDCHDFALGLKRGDRLSRPETTRKNYAVQSVDYDQTLGLVIKARSL